MVRGLQLQCAWVLNETLLAPVLMYGSETIIMEWFGVTKGQMKVFFNGSAMWREWGMIGLLKKYM